MTRPKRVIRICAAFDRLADVKGFLAATVLAERRINPAFMPCGE